MSWSISFFIASISLWIIIIFTRVQVTTHFQKKKKDDRMTVEVRAWFGLIYIRYELPMARIADDFTGMFYDIRIENDEKILKERILKITPSQWMKWQNTMRNIMDHVRDIHDILRSFLHEIHVHTLRWHSHIGLAEADRTAVLTGACWGIKSNMIGLASSYISLHTVPNLHVQPVYQSQCLQTDFLCMFRMRLGNAMLAGVRIVRNIRKRRAQTWQNIQSKA